MNKIKTILVTVLIIFLLAACSKPANDNGNEANEDLRQESDEDTPKQSPDQKDDQDTNADQSDAKDEIDWLDFIENLPDKSIATIVNKQFPLSENYAPDDLVTVDVPTVLENPEVKQLRKVAAEALFEMFEAAKIDDVYLHARSGYRSYNTQVSLFNSYKERNGEEAANRYSARAGQSEHQTGLVMDVTSESVNLQLVEEFGQVTEGIWLTENAHKYGFIIRYPQGKEDITGYIYEPWHLRYLGVDLAEAIFESGLTYEEFLDEEGFLSDVLP